MLAVPGSHTPIDWKLLLCAAKVRYIDGDKRSSSRKSVSPGAPGAFRRIATSCSGSGYDSGRISTLLSTLNTAVFAPMPMASVSTTVIANPGDRPSRRHTCFRSTSSDWSLCHCHTSRLRSRRSVTLPKSRRALRSASSRGMPSSTSSSIRSSMCSWMEIAMSSYRRFLKKQRLNRANPHLLCFCRGKHTCKTRKHPLETDNFSFEMTNARIREPINSRWSTLGRGPSLSFQQAFLQHSLQRRIERTLFHLEQVVGDLLDVLHQRIAMHGL